MIDLLVIYFDFINNYIEKYFIFTFIIYFLLLIIYNSISLPGNLFLFVFSGFIFDFYFGFFINLLTITIGSFNFFIFSKLFFKYYFINFYKKYSLKINLIIKKSSFEYLILLRLIPGTPLIVQNICLSILNVSKTKFLLTTLIGFTPLMLVSSYIGSKFSNFIELKTFDTSKLFSKSFLIFLSIIIILIIIRVIFKKTLYKK